MLYRYVSTPCFQMKVDTAGAPAILYQHIHLDVRYKLRLLLFQSHGLGKGLGAHRKLNRGIKGHSR